MRLKTLLISLITLILVACSTGDKNHEKPQVYTTVFPIYSMTKQIAGDTINVESIYPKNVNVHSYEPSQKDVLDYANGDLFIYTNHELDPLANKLDKAIGKKTEILEAFQNDTEAIKTNHEHEENHDDHSHGEYDPHVWLDPELSSIMAENIKDKLIELNPKDQKIYEDNYRILKSELKELTQQLENITEDKKRDTVYISHESIGYLADKYNFTQVGINGLNDEEPSQKELIEMIHHINDTDIPYILYEQNVSSKITDMLGKETNADYLSFHNLESITDDDPENATYQSIMKENIDSLDKALNN